MNLKQINILISLGLFLVFDLISLVLYQAINQSLVTAKQVSPEIIATYNVSLDVKNLQTLAEMVGKPALSTVPPPPFTGLVEPKSTLIVNKESIGIYLFNGSGINGNASAAAQRLSREGYVVKGIANADRNDYLKTTVRYAKENNTLAKDLQLLLKSLYNEIVLDDDGNDRQTIQIVLGQPAQ